MGVGSIGFSVPEAGLVQDLSEEIVQLVAAESPAARALLGCPEIRSGWSNQQRVPGCRCPGREVAAPGSEVDLDMVG
jgi:hypothetical protein